jgi:hypothetical protein
MRPLFIIIALLFSQVFTIAQARIVFNANPYVVMNGGIYIVQANPATNAISGAGRIISEAETNRVRWMIGTSTGTYTMPFGYTGAISIPHSITIGTAGVGATGYIDFSTYRTPTFMNTPWATGVTHLTNNNTLLPNQTYVLDRWWITNAASYTTKPALSGMLFTYIDAEWLAVGNTISEANLQAQRFNTTANVWYDMAPIGVVNTGANTVTISTAVSSANFFRPWVLVDNLYPLPVVLSDFNATCNATNKTAELNWTTQSETNNDYFMIERSTDGFNFEQIAIVDGAGNSNITLNYTFIDDSPLPVTSYYRLSQFDFSNYKTEGNILSFENCFNNVLDALTIVTDGNSNFLQINAITDGVYTLELFDASGKIIQRENVTVSKGNNIFAIENIFAQGIYFLRASNDLQSVTKKLIIKK